VLNILTSWRIVGNTYQVGVKGAPMKANFCSLLVAYCLLVEEL
jgi:hypothetical protein